VPSGDALGWEVWADVRTGVGECPMWEPALGAIFWVDLYGPTLSSSSGPGEAVRTWTLPSMPGAFAFPADGPGAIVALDASIAHLDLVGGGTTMLVAAPYDPLKFRFNDGRCDAAGRFWVGTNRQPGSGEPRGSAAFYRLDDRGLVRVVDGVTIANGLAFSPDGSTMYVADTIAHRLWAFDYDLASGTPSRRRVFADLEEGSLPDGAAVDEDGGYWVAMYGAGVVVRFTPDGRQDRVIEAPVSRPTMVAFGGPDMSTLFLTTAHRFADPESLTRQPSLGAVFHRDVGARGTAEPRFAHLGDGPSVPG
jgi:L-arabinonolactonase